MEERLGAVNSCYYGSFIPGMQEVIAETIRERLPDVRIVKLLDGAVVFETEVSYDKLNFFCFNNIFAIIDIDENAESPEIHLRKICTAGKSALPQKSLNIISENNKKIQSFRFVFSIENKPVEVSEKLKQDAEKLITRNSSLKLNRIKPDTEFWFLFRREGFSCFMKRLTNRSSGEKSPQPGELSPQLAWLLCRIAELKHGETVTDPFCGYGSIPNAACKHFPIAQFYASDIDSRCIKICRSQAALKKTNRCTIFEADFRSIINRIPAETADAIVSDPPWGLYKETKVPLQLIYDDIINIFPRLLKNRGRAVILSAAVKEFNCAVEKKHAFTMRKIIPVLVSGKKASVFVIDKHVDRLT